jgi:phosphoribosyl 1,2-cyclic phosphodiesterase
MNITNIPTLKINKLTQEQYDREFLAGRIDETALYLTPDTGIIDEKYFKLLRSINTILIESNHDEQLLQKSNRPYFLKQRILSTTGHLSNKSCVSYLKEIVSEKTTNVILAHLSEECNTESLALSEVKNAFEEIFIIFIKS